MLRRTLKPNEPFVIQDKAGRQIAAVSVTKIRPNGTVELAIETEFPIVADACADVPCGDEDENTEAG